MSYTEALSELTNYPKALSHAGSGGGFALKSISFTNAAGTDAVIYRCINAEGKYINPSDSDGYVIVPNGETVTVYYAEPAIGSYWVMYADSTNAVALQTTASGITADGTELTITAEAPEGATAVIELYEAPGGGDS